MLDFGAARHGFSADDTPEGRMGHKKHSAAEPQPKHWTQIHTD
jgi:hypothetical protein